MLPGFSLQSPYVIASLPWPIDREAGQYAVGEVYGGARGSKKRKRSEMVIGIDGEGVNLYDISSSKLITSYALPPQATFTCSPISSRSRSSKNKVERWTYTSTLDKQLQITLFHDITEGSNAPKTSTMSYRLTTPTTPVVFLSTITAASPIDTTGDHSELLIVKQNGDMQGLDAETLNERWTSPASILTSGSELPALNSLVVEYAQLSNAYAVSQNLLKDRQDLYAMFPQEITKDGYNPDILIAITRMGSSSENFIRRLCVIAFPQGPTDYAAKMQRSPQVLLNTQFGSSQPNASPKAIFSVHVSSGILQQLNDTILTTFHLTSSGLRQQSTAKIEDSNSFLHLSTTSTMLSTNSSITVINPKYVSALATISLHGTALLNSDRKEWNEELALNGRSQNVQLLSYFPKNGVVVAILGNNLVAVQVEGSQARSGKKESSGLLIDSLGRSIHNQSGSGLGKDYKHELANLDSKVLLGISPGSILAVEPYWTEQTREAEAAFAERDTTAFDKVLLDRLGVSPERTPHHIVTKSISREKSSCPLQNLSQINRRWAMYALSKIFGTVESGSGQVRIFIAFHPPKLFLWLINSGYMTVSNIQAALRSSANFSDDKMIEPGSLVHSLAETNPDMDLVLALIEACYLNAEELVFAIRSLMDSLEMLGSDVGTKNNTLTNGEDFNIFEDNTEEQLENQLKELEAEAQHDLELAEYQLGPGSDIRGQALSLALSKLYARPTNQVVRALQTLMTSEEIICLIYLLRYELSRGAWTLRCLDLDIFDADDEDADIPNNAINLISGLLNNCIDAVGAGGCLTGNSSLINGNPFDTEEMISSLKLEVSAALENMEEALYMRGLTSEMMRYIETVQKIAPQEPNLAHDTKPKASSAMKRKRTQQQARPILVHSGAQTTAMLPVGLKLDHKVSRRKIGAGGEVNERTARERGHLKSQKVGKYTLERIAV